LVTQHRIKECQLYVYCGLPQVIDQLRKHPGEFHEKGIHSKFWKWMPSSFGQPPWAVPWSETYFSPRHLHEIGIEDYTAAEIEKVFQKYDLNGDGVLQRNEVCNYFAPRCGYALRLVLVH
jgi:hypothetical protein